MIVEESVRLAIVIVSCSAAAFGSGGNAEPSRHAENGALGWEAVWAGEGWPSGPYFRKDLL